MGRRGRLRRTISYALVIIWNRVIMAKDSVEKQSKPVESLPIVAAGAPEAEQALASMPIIEEAAEEAAPSERRHIVKSATLVMLGNLGSSLMGMVRQIVVAALGSSVAAPFTSAISP